MTNWNSLANAVLDGRPISRDDALAVANAPDDELLAVLHAAYRVRKRYHGNKVRVHVLQNAKAGRCSEDCGFCSQSGHHAAEIEVHPLQEVEELVAGADKAAEMGAVTFCMVTASRGPNDRVLEVISEAARRIKARHGMKLCASLGMLKPGQAEALREAGVDRYNHNLETSRGYFGNIVGTHRFEDRAQTIRKAKAAGLEACAGGLIGMGESREDWVDLAFELREMRVESVPLNFLNPRPGTPVGEAALRRVKDTGANLRPQDCLKALAMFRFVHPDVDVRVAGGREAVLGQMQPLSLYAANSIFTNGYLTTGGQSASADHQMITQAGFEPEVVGAQS